LLLLSIKTASLTSRSTRYSTFVRIGTGLSLSDYEWIKDKPWKRFDKKNPPPWLNLSSLVGSDDKGDMYIEPEEYVRRPATTFLAGCHG